MYDSWLFLGNRLRECASMIPFPVPESKYLWFQLLSTMMFCNWQLWKPLYVAAGFCDQQGDVKGPDNRQSTVLALHFCLLVWGTCACFVASAYD